MLGYSVNVANRLAGRSVIEAFQRPARMECPAYFAASSPARCVSFFTMRATSTPLNLPDPRCPCRLMERNTGPPTAAACSSQVLQGANRSRLGIRAVGDSDLPPRSCLIDLGRSRSRNGSGSLFDGADQSFGVRVLPGLWGAVSTSSKCSRIRETVHFGDCDAEQLHLAMNPWRTPEWFGCRHLFNQPRISVAVKGRPRLRHGGFDNRAQIGETVRAATAGRWWAERRNSGPRQTRNKPTQNNRPTFFRTGRLRFLRKLRVEGGARRSPWRWLHDRWSGVERVEKRIKRRHAYVPIVRFQVVSSQLLTSGRNKGEGQLLSSPCLQRVINLEQTSGPELVYPFLDRGFRLGPTDF